MLLLFKITAITGLDVSLLYSLYALMAHTNNVCMPIFHVKYIIAVSKL